MIPDFLSVLSRSRLFADMPQSVIAEALGRVGYTVVQRSRGDVYALVGQTLGYVDVMLDGQMVAWMVGDSGRQLEVLRLAPGDVVAPCFVFAADGVLPTTIETLSDVTMLRMTRQAFGRLIDESAVLRWNFVRILSDIGSFLATRMRFIALLTVREKVACYLLSEMACQQSRTLWLKYTRQHIADTFGIQKFSLLRCLAELAAEGVVSISGRQITILAPDRLR